MVEGVVGRLQVIALDLLIRPRRIVYVGGDEFSMGNAGVDSLQPIGPAGFVSGASPVVVTNGTTRMSKC